jgi:hypothetical protein
MIKNKLFFEIFDEFEKAETKADRIAVLKKYDDPRLRTFLIYSLEPTIEFDVEIPNYRPAVEPAGLNFTYLDNEMPKAYRFVKNHESRPAGLTPEKQKSLLVVILESLHKDEAELFVRMLKKDLDIKHLTKKLVQEAYPGI